MIVTIGGPPHSGKTVFVNCLYHRLLKIKSSGFAFVQRANPDGEGMHTTEADPHVSAVIRRKKEFSDEFIEAAKKSVENLSKAFPLVLVDLGGKIAPDSIHHVSRSDYFICLSATDDAAKEWIALATQVGTTTLANLSSRLVYGPDGPDTSARSTIDLSAVPITGTLVNLTREKPYNVCHREAIGKLADFLFSFVTRGQSSLSAKP